jgi:hypothetical protein
LPHIPEADGNPNRGRSTMRVSSIFPLTIIGAAVCLAAPMAAKAQDQLVTFADPELILDIAKGYGAANLDKDSDGNPMISGRLQSVKYSIYFYSCENGANCRSIQFSTGYTDPFTIEKANEWNTKYRWVKSYESDGSNFRMDVDFKGGISRDNVDAQFETWDSLITTIKEFVAGQ